MKKTRADSAGFFKIFEKFFAFRALLRDKFNISFVFVHFLEII